MKIATVSGFSAIWGNEMPPNILDLEKGRTVGGGEEAALRTAAGLAAAGHEVTLWWCGLPGEWRGVQFRSDKDALAAALTRERHDVIIGWSTILPFQFGKPGALRLFAQQLNDCWAPGNWGTVDAVISPSRDHAMQLPKWGWKNKPWTVVHNGLDPELYGGPRYDPICGGWISSVELSPGENWRNRPLNVGYWSSPDRGLHHLLEAWPAVVAKLPQARLHVFYEIDRWLNSGAARSIGCYGDRARKMARELLPRAKADPTITFHGAVTRKELAKTQLQCRVQCYPYQPIDYCEGFCHPAGTMILTKEGHKAIETLTVQDQVLGHSGKWRGVSATKRRRFEGQLVNVLPACGEAVEMTDDHPVLASDDGKNFAWTPAGKLRVDMWLKSVTPESPDAPSTIQLPPPTVTPAQLKSQQTALENFGGKDPIELPLALPLTPELCRLVGYFAGDGNASKRGRNAGSLSFFIGTEQKDIFAQDIVGCVAKVFGVRPTIEDCRPKKKMLSIRLHSAPVARVFGAWCYGTDGQKKLPEWVMDLPLHWTNEVLKGLWRTDGSVVDQGKARFAGFTSSSANLIGQVRTLISKTGRRVRIQKRLHKTGQTSWSVYFSIAGEFLDYGSKGVAPMEHYYSKKLENGEVALRIREVVKTPTLQNVYAITVEEDESYHVGNFVVHNCGAVNQGIAAGTHVLTTPHDALPSLYGNAVSYLPGDAIEMQNVLAPTIVRALTDEAWSLARVKQAKPNRFKYTWESATQEMLRAVKGEWDSERAP